MLPSTMELSPTQRSVVELSPHTALNPVLVSSPLVCILTVMVGPVLVKGPGMELPENVSLYNP